MRYITFLLLGMCVQLSAQDPSFTNTSQSLVALNPSFAGSNGLIRYQAIDREQWYNLSGSYSTFYNSFDAYIKPLRGGIALTYSRNNQARGTIVTNRVDLTYAQHLSFMEGKLKIIPSIQISGFQKTLDLSKLTFGDMIDPRRGFVYNTTDFSLEKKIQKTNLDFSSGLIVNYKHLYLGATVFHITQPEEGFIGSSQLPYRLSLFTSYNLAIGTHLLLNGMYRFEKQQDFYMNQFKINALYKHLVLSVGFLTNNAITTSIGFRHNYFTLSGGYEFGISRLSGATAGSYELSASFNLRNKDDRKVVKDFERW